MRFFNKKIVGIDIDSTEIRAVELSGPLKNPEIINVGRIYLPEGTVKEGKILNSEKVTAALKELWHRNGFVTKNVVFGANNSDVIVRFALFPKLPEEKLSNLIKFQASDYIPYPLEDVELDYSIISEVESEGGHFYNVLLVAARKDMLYSFIKTLEQAHITIKDIKSTVLVMDRLLPQKHKNDTVVMVNICFDACNILILDKNIPAFARTITFNTSINESMKTIYKQTDATGKEQYGQNRQNNSNVMLMDKTDSVVDSATDNAIEYISSNIRSSISYFQSQNRNSRIERIYLMGSAVSSIEMVEELVKSLEDNIGRYMEVLKPCSYLYDKLFKQYKFKEDATEFAIAFSLALHGLGR